MRYLLFVVVLFFVGCSSRVDVKPSSVLNENLLPQKAIELAQKSALPDKPLVNSVLLDLYTKKYREMFFSPWFAEYNDINDVAWAWDVYTTKKGFGANKLAIDVSWYDKTLNNAQLDKYPILSVNAISVKPTALRNFPTDLPFYYDFEKAGEGFPFDYLQNTTIHPFTPLKILHITQDKAWFFVKSSIASGWVKPQDIAFVSKNDIDKIINLKLIALKKDNLALTDMNDNFLFYTGVGALFPLKNSIKTKYQIYVPKRDLDGSLVLDSSSVDKDIAGIQPIEYTKIEMASLIDEMLGQMYGWGGTFFLRDCSSTIRDLFAPFGIWLPRNSYAQSKAGDGFSFDEKDTKDSKLDLISKLATPFHSLLYFNGHIGIYLGEYNGTPMIFHNIWGYKIFDGKSESRAIIGKAVITTMEDGKNLDLNNPNGLIDRLRGIVKPDGLKEY